MTTQEDNRAEQQARSKLESIVEMVQNLDPEKAREAAAQEYSKTLSRKECKKILRDCHIECYAEESLEELREAVAVNIADKTCEPEGFDFDEDLARDEALERILEHPLSVQVRSGWCNSKQDMEPEEFSILLCTGGLSYRYADTQCADPDDSHDDTETIFELAMECRSNVPASYAAAVAAADAQCPISRMI